MCMSIDMLIENSELKSAFSDITILHDMVRRSPEPMGRRMALIWTALNNLLLYLMLQKVVTSSVALLTQWSPNRDFMYKCKCIYVSKYNLIWIGLATFRIN